MIDKRFCKALSDLRKAKNLTQAGLERSSGLPEMVISHYENGTRKPGLENIRALCKGLGCSASDLIN